MAVPTLGLGTALGIGVEVTPGTPVARVTWLKLMSWNVTASAQVLRTDELCQGTAGDAFDDGVVSKTVAGDFEVLARYEGLGYLLQAILGGTPTTSGTYDHACELALALPKLTLEAVRGDDTVSDLVGGFTAGSFALRVQPNSYPVLRVSGMGMVHTRPAKGTPSNVTAEKMLPSHCGNLTWNSVAYKLAGLELTGDNGVTELRELSDLWTSEPFVNSIREFRIKATLISAQSDALLTAHMAGTESDATVTLTGGTSPNALAITLRNAKVVSHSDPITQHGYITQEIELLGKADAVDSSLSLVYSNGQANYFD